MGLQPSGTVPCFVRHVQPGEASVGQVRAGFGPLGVFWTHEMQASPPGQGSGWSPGSAGGTWVTAFSWVLGAVPGPPCGRPLPDPVCSSAWDRVWDGAGGQHPREGQTRPQHGAPLLPSSAPRCPLRGKQQTRFLQLVTLPFPLFPVLRCSLPYKFSSKICYQARECFLSAFFTVLPRLLVVKSHRTGSLAAPKGTGS